MTAEPLPRPLVAAGAVTIDARTRELVVRPARDVRGYAKVLWAEGVRAQAEAASGYAGDAPTVWASACGESKVTYGLPAGDDALKFRCSRGDPVYQKLVSTPGLRATIVVDRGSSQILGVRFHGRPSTTIGEDLMTRPAPRPHVAVHPPPGQSSTRLACQGPLVTLLCGHGDYGAR